MMQKAHFRNPLISDANVYSQSFNRKRLTEAWTKVWQNEGAAGGDGISVHDFQRGLVQRIAEIEQDLDKGDYSHGPLRRVMIPKKSGGERPLDIPCVRDRIVQTALTMTLSPLLDTEFEEASFGYRAGRSVQQAVRRVEFLRRHGFTHVVDADIKRYFERVPHDALMERLGQSMSEGPTSQLIGHWLEHSSSNGRGLAQGSPLSPLLANLYLDRLDEELSQDGLRIVRFADDFVVLCRSDTGAEEALTKTERLLARKGLELNREKTRVTDFDDGFRFLGHVFVRSFAFPDPENELTVIDEELRSIASTDEEDAKQQAELEEADSKRKRARLDPGQRILYLTKGGRQLSVRNHAFLVRESVLGTKPDGTERSEEWRDLILIHPADVDRIEISHNAGYDNEALQHALATNTEIAFVNGHGETLGWVTKGHDGRAKRQLLQAKAALDTVRKLEIAKAFVDGRIRNERALLRRLNRNRSEESVIKALSHLNHLIRRIPYCPDIDVLRGLEGRAAALYWPCFGKMLVDNFHLKTRDRDSADPVNIMLNMTAWLLARDIAVAVSRAGLHSGFGFLHEARDHGDALVYDLMEEFRAPLAEAVVSAAINQRAVNALMFMPKPGTSQSRLLAEGQKALIRTYEKFAERSIKDPISGRNRSWRALMSDQAIRLAQALENGTPYQALAMDY